MSSCSLLKIESAQEPLSKQDLNIRLLTQSLVNEANNRVEFAADSIISSSTNTELQKHAYRWKIETLNTFKNTAFQSSPKLSLMDTWTYMLQVRNFMETDAAMDYFGSYTSLVAKVSQDNVDDIEKKAKRFFKPEEFIKHQNFAYQYADKYPISHNNLRHNSVRSEYVEFLKVPDSLAFTTVGTLSEVVSNFSDKLTYSTDAAGKQFKWNTELMLKEKGFDSVQIKDIMLTVEKKVDRLSDIAENTPEKLDMALKSFSNDMAILFYSLNNQIEFVSEQMSLERQAIDTIIRRERIALDSIIMREREAVVDQAGEISVRVMDEAMIHLKDLTGTILFYVVLLFAVLLFLPFALGYFAGKVHQKIKQHKKES
ncbi:hypothetical protein OS188_12080 [Xanthomarina sp. F1114]|uniref:hypothetical protein n=1 Tax=Xanthomarina sp. F1114 TaxID=2996019 RepID=UPI00225DE015|nr:hypothetical protein [Xanthomarina sp. F1114]MCX7548691.1 hypothetical protein [Xanthomarina sp. F1114]